MPDCLLIVQDAAHWVCHKRSNADKKAGKNPRQLSILHFAVQPRFAVPVADFVAAFEQLLDPEQLCLQWRAAAGFDFLDPDLPPPASKQMAVCLAALQHLIQTAAVAYKAAIAYQHIRGGGLSFSEVLAEAPSSRALASALDSYPAQPDAMMNDIADGAKHELAALLGYPPHYIPSSPATSDSDEVSACITATRQLRWYSKMLRHSTAGRSTCQPCWRPLRWSPSLPWQSNSQRWDNIRRCVVDCNSVLSVR